LALLVERNTGSDHLDGFTGLAKGSLGLALITTVFLLSLTGIPPTAGFVGKFYLFGAAISSQTWWWLGLVGIINSAISLYYYMNIARLMFFTDHTTDWPERPAGVMFVVWLSLVVTLVLCVVPGPLLTLARQAGTLLTGN
jgi:NADH-quinone oxidoreductase subunit N